MPTVSATYSSRGIINAETTAYIPLTISGIPSEAYVTSVRYRMRLDSSVSEEADLGKVDVLLRAPGGHEEDLFARLDWLGRQDDGGDDSDSDSDYDIYFSGGGFRVARQPRL